MFKHALAFLVPNAQDYPNFLMYLHRGGSDLISTGAFNFTNEYGQPNYRASRDAPDHGEIDSKDSAYGDNHDGEWNVGRCAWVSDLYFNGPSIIRAGTFTIRHRWWNNFYYPNTPYPPPAYFQTRFERYNVLGQYVSLLGMTTSWLTSWSSQVEQDCEPGVGISETSMDAGDRIVIKSRACTNAGHVEFVSHFEGSRPCYITYTKS